ncbi:MAG TPA: PglZ domain-containing protein [Flavobacteriales bacterium]|nr:PglZ domain-containing protein [Flavobacteriales bacterium]HRJ36331.1 PglZ domain-containing protein [Flavobacteriales bacterium]HRJ39417.1 PglZ domain-containing protein [Flavobacteriales bacterium]
MENINILWADDEIDLLKPHVMFLEQKGYQVTTVNNGADAVDKARSMEFSIVFLDENMPGLSGLETLERIKAIKPGVPVVMITKSEEESIMDSAIGGKIADYLIKPVNPNQILLTLKKNLDSKRLVTEKTTMNYQQEFRQIGMQLGDLRTVEEWKDMFRKLVYWEIELEKIADPGLHQILQMQKVEANNLFSRFVGDNYLDWVNGKADDIPLMSHQLLRKKLLPDLEKDPVFLLVVDNLRFDQWKIIRPFLMEFFTEEEEDLYFSILPTATQYARNALFAGLMPSEIQKKYPSMWMNDDDEGSKNNFEKEFLEGLLKMQGKNVKFSYNKITNLNAGKKVVDQFNNLLGNQLNVIVYNFVDMLSHARTDMEVIRELADNEVSYRSITRSWFEHSPLFELCRKVAEKKLRLVITTDHGTVHVQEPSKIVGDRNTNTNLRYKQGKNLNYNSKDVFEVKNPADAFLPKVNVSTTYVFAKDYKFFVYPNNYNQFVNFYQGTFQHGGISMEEMIIPYVSLKAR